MNYQSRDKFTNRYLSSDAFTSLKNKLGGRSITSLGNKKYKNFSRLKIANQGFDLLDYKTLIYRIFISIILLLILIYIIPQTRYWIHGYNSDFIDNNIDNTDINTYIDDSLSIYNIAPEFLKTDRFIAKQKDNYIDNGMYVIDYFNKNIIGMTYENSSSTIGIKLFSDPGFKNSFLIAYDLEDKDNNILENSTTTDSININNSSTSLASSSDSFKKPTIIKHENNFYQSYVFEGIGYGQLIARIPPEIKVKKDSKLYIRTVDGLKPVANIVDINEDNNSTFTIINAQMLISPQNLYKVLIK